MDSAVKLVQAYLNLNGYFTVTEYPIVRIGPGEPRVVTDLDVLAFRFPGAGAATAGRKSIKGPVLLHPDPALGGDPKLPDMLIGEVKEGVAEFNRPARDARVVAAALARFGCCSEGDSLQIAERLVQMGKSQMPTGHVARMVAFGSRSGSPTKWHVVTMSHVISFMRGFLLRHWADLNHVEFKNEAFAMVALLEKAGALDG